MNLFIPIIVFIAFGVFAIYSYLEGEKKRKLRYAALTAAAGKLGLRITPFDRRFEDWLIFDTAVQLKKGHSRYAYNVMRGDSANRDVTAFDYHYAITRKSGKTTTTSHYYISCVAIGLPVDVPWLTVFEEGFDSKVAQFFGYDDIDFESKAFSDAYCVRSADKRFAYDVIHPEMMEYLMARPGLVFEIAENMLLITSGETIEAAGFSSFIARARALRDLIPSRLFDTR